MQHRRGERGPGRVCRAQQTRCGRWSVQDRRLWVGVIALSIMRVSYVAWDDKAIVLHQLRVVLVHAAVRNGHLLPSTQQPVQKTISDPLQIHNRTNMVTIAA